MWRRKTTKWKWNRDIKRKKIIRGTGESSVCVCLLYTVSQPLSRQKRKREKRDDDLILKLFKTLQSLSSLHRRVDTGEEKESQITRRKKARWVSVSCVWVCTTSPKQKRKKIREKIKEMSTASSTNSAGSMSSSAVVHSSLASLVASNETDKTQGATQGPSPHRRYHFSPMQTMELNNAFSQNPYPSVKYRQELATRLGIDQKVRMCSSCRYLLFSIDSLSRH